MVRIQNQKTPKFFKENGGFYQLLWELSNPRHQQGPRFETDLSGDPYLKLMCMYKDYIRFYLYEAPRVIKFREWGGGCQGLAEGDVSGYGVLLEEDGDCGNGWWWRVLNSVDGLNAIEMYILNGTEYVMEVLPQ